MKQSFQPVLQNPDPSYYAYMKKIGFMYFGIEPPKKKQNSGGLMGMIQNLMSDLGDMDSDGGE